MVNITGDGMSMLKPVPNLEDQTCFGCGAADPYGLQMTFHRDDERVYSFVTVPESMARSSRTSPAHDPMSSAHARDAYARVQ